jgi:hypothetical protein
MTMRAARNYTYLAVLLALMAGGAIRARAQVSASPTSIDFGSVAVNLEGFTTHVILTNNSTGAVKLTGLTFSEPQFGLYTGLPVQTLAPKQSVTFAFVFLATQAGSYSAIITFGFQGLPPVTVQASATAFTTTAVATVSPTSLDFGTVNFGSTSVQSVTVSNSAAPGSDTLTVVSPVAYYQPFAVSGPAAPINLAPGQSATFQVTFSPLLVGSTTGAVAMCYTALPCTGVDLTGTGALPAQLALTNYPILPYATQGYPYQANLTATGGTPPYSFKVLSGKMPAGITLAASGAIAGTIGSKDALGNYAFSAQVRDSSIPRLTATENITIAVDAKTGSNCDITSVDVPNTTTPLVDLMDLGTSTYLGYQGGLYPDGSNTDPDPHHSDGVSIAQSIQPIDGKIGMISIGESATQQGFENFIEQANADPERNPSLLIVDGAQGGATGNTWVLGSSAFWTELLDYSLPFWGLKPNQVEIALVNDVNSQQGATFPSDAQELQSDYETIAQLLLQKFPNMKMVFFSSQNYTGYSQGISTTLPEPQAYESAWGAKWAIEDQIDGTCCNYNPNNGPVTAPWMGWSVYYWANGLIPRSDGITWSCPDIKSDGLHPSVPIGEIKVGGYLLDWFKTADLATPWFVQSGAR